MVFCDLGVRMLDALGVDWGCQSSSSRVLIYVSLDSCGVCANFCKSTRSTHERDLVRVGLQSFLKVLLP